ncbi:hypothetical protein CFP65_0108 [Kitasatospora sp. MMS16-BH015]|nr:hypothetical protein CFP65_0108 [Kitasatospora sp. MMS16-BH015]
MMLTLLLLTTPPVLAVALAHSGNQPGHRRPGPPVRSRHTRTGSGGGGRHAVRPTGSRKLA